MNNKFTNINEALDYLNSLKSGVADPTNSGYQLDRIQRFLSIFGNPQFAYPVIHIGGTAGKGSTSIMTAKLLSELGFKVGLHTSPYLVSINEKFQLVKDGNTKDCSDDELVVLINNFAIKQEEFVNLGNEPLTFYEAVISMVFEYFKIKNVDVAVIEVAMGGRLDATNVVNSDVAVLNSVGMDHMEFLGDTIEKIAWDKMHIMKEGKKFVCGIEIPNIVDMFQEHATKLNSKLFLKNKDFYLENVRQYQTGSIFDFISPNIEFRNLSLPLFGSYQVHNALLAIKAVMEFLETNKNQLTESIINRAFRNIRIKGRFDIVQTNPVIVLDGAHNQMKMHGLVSSILSHKKFSQLPKKILIGFKQGKDVKSILIEILQLNPSEIFVTEFTKDNALNTKPYPAEDILNILTTNNFNQKHIYLFKDKEVAWNNFKNSLKNGEMGIVTGSLYLIGNIYKIIDAK